jgi:SSS family solute:Na+ symporter
VLYSGSIAVMKLFDVPGLFGLGNFEALVLTILTIGIVGALYAVTGGLKAVAVSDTLNGVGLLIVGILAPVLGLMALGGGDFFAGLSTITSNHTEKLNAIGDGDSPIPFGTIFTGMIFANLFYWCTNQYVIQRTLAARNLAEGQKGVLFSGFFKVLVPLFMMIPGVIAFHLFGPRFGTIDEAYPALIREVFPIWMMGFFLAVLLGAVFSSFNSLLNSAATMFTLDIYGPLKGKEIGDKESVRVAMIASVVIAVFSFGVAPLLSFAPEGLWQVIRVFTGFYNIPIIAIVLVGLFTKHTPAIAAKIVIVLHVIAYGLAKFVFDDVITIHFLHLYAILFVTEVAIMLIAGRVKPRADAWAFKHDPKVDLTPWRFARPVAFALLSCVVGLYVLFSPLGLVGDGNGIPFSLIIAALVAANIYVFTALKRPVGH